MGLKQHMNKYTLPNGTLKNKLGITDQEKLNKAERAITFDAEGSIPKFSLDFNGLKKIHHHLFQDVYEWAGQSRMSTLQKDRDTPAFTPPALIERQAHKIFTELKDKNNLQNLDKDSFSKEVAYLFGHINNLHPFREGNGRTQRIFIKEVAKQAGYEIDFSQTTKERMIQASIEFNQGKPKKMEEIFIEALDKQMIADLKPFNQLLIEQKGVDGWNNLFVAHSHENTNYKGTFVGTNKKDFVIQLTEPINTLEKNSIIISNYTKDFKYLNNQEPKVGDKITLNIPPRQLENEIQYSNRGSHTGKIILVDEKTIVQQKLNGTLVHHDTQKLPNITPKDVGSSVKITYHKDGASVEPTGKSNQKTTEKDKELGNNGKNFGLDD